MNYFKRSLTLTIILMTFVATAVAQQKTTVVVRALAKDAKFIGSSMGGALITIRNAKTNEVLAKGRTKGSTGNTDKLVRTPKKRYEKISTNGSAKFTAKIELEKPVYVTVSATSTYRKEQEVTSSTQLWLIPGNDITGDGIILELPGFVVDIIDIQTVQKEKGGTRVEVATKVVMMCGCPTRPDGLWDSSKFKMRAVIKQRGEVIHKKPLTFSGKTNIYNGSFKIKSPGNYQVMVYAFDPRTENNGIDMEPVHIQ